MKDCTDMIHTISNQRKNKGYDINKKRNEKTVTDTVLRTSPVSARPALVSEKEDKLPVSYLGLEHTP